MNIDRVVAVICILAAVTNKEAEKVEALLLLKIQDEATDLIWSNEFCSDVSLTGILMQNRSERNKTRKCDSR